MSIRPRLSGLAPALLAMGVGCGAMLATRSEPSLGASTWAWILTTAGVSAIWLVSRRNRAGWLLGVAVQTCWIVYAVGTVQWGFIPGCAVSLAIQLHAWLASSPSLDRNEA